MSKRGRPPVKAQQRKDESVQIRVTKSDKRLLDKVSGGNLSEWARAILLRVANRARK